MRFSELSNPATNTVLERTSVRKMPAGTPALLNCYYEAIPVAVSRTQLRWLIAAAAAAFLTIILTSTLHQTSTEYEVCVNYHGNNHCATAEGSTSDEAIRSARDIDCQLLSTGRDDNVVCLDTQPSSVRQIR